MDPDGTWTSPSDLADYAYCPRSHWYRHHPPAKGPSNFASGRRRWGEQYHFRTFTAERHRDERGGAYWVAVLAGLGILVLGVAWLLHF
jgi:CRISPR/Cas system-associated exonuclease Cas4 (RecB family)